MHKKKSKFLSDIVKGELKLIFSDAGAVLFFLAAMVIYPLLYALGYEKETVRELPIAVVDLDHTSTSRQFGRMVDATEQMQVSFKPGSLKEAEQLFYKGKINGVVLIPEDFEKNILRGIRTNATVYCDAGYFMLYRQVYSGAIFSSGTFGAGIEIKRLLLKGTMLSQAMDQQEPVKTEVYNLYNPSGGYGSFVMPGMVIIIIQQTLLVGIGMLGGTIREKRNFLKQYGSVSRRWGNVKLVFGKSLAYVSVYLLTSIFALLVLHNWFHFPDRGSFFPILSLLIPYLFSVSFLGMAVSMLFKERVHSILFLVFVSPVVVFLSGISWPVSAVPFWLYQISHVFPSSFMVPAYIRLRVMGAPLEAARLEHACLVLQMILYFILACLSYKYAIRKMGQRIGSRSIN